MASVARPVPSEDIGIELVRDWVPDGTPRAHIVLVHGIAEHCGRYERTGSLLAEAGSQREFISRMGWMNPIYAELRKALVAGNATSEERALLRINLGRARALPQPRGRYILVNASSARLTTFL